MLTGERLLRRQTISAASRLILGTRKQGRAVLAGEIGYAMYHNVEARLLVPIAVINVMTSLASGLLFRLRRITAASELVSNVPSTEDMTSFREIYVIILMFCVEGECMTVSVEAIFDRRIDRGNP